MFPENISKNFDRVKEIAFSNLPMDEKMLLFEEFDEIMVFYKDSVTFVKNCFLPIDGFEDYAVSPFGDVISSKGKYGKMIVRVLSKVYDGRGYYTVKFCFNEKTKREKIHRIVASTFLPKPDKMPLVNHKDGNKENNRLNNLEFCTAEENAKHAHRTGLCNKRGKLTQDELDQIVDMLNAEISHKEIANKFNVSENAIHNIAAGRTHNDLFHYINVSKEFSNMYKTKVKCIETGKTYASQNEAEKELKLYRGTVTRCLQSKISHVNGYHFQKVEEKES